MYCAICSSDVGEFYTIDCDHSFHTECIMNWFRSGRSSCPLCRDPGQKIISSFGASGTMSRFSHIKRLASYDSCPSHIKDLIQNVAKDETTVTEMEEELEEFKKSADGKFSLIHRKITKQMAKIEIEKYRLRNKKKCISFMNCDRIIIPVKKEISESNSNVNHSP